jgi:hypothetical protein
MREELIRQTTEARREKAYRDWWEEQYREAKVEIFHPTFNDAKATFGKPVK